MDWPTKEEVDAATPAQLEAWWLDLPLPYRLSEMIIMERISIRRKPPEPQGGCY